LPLDGGGKCWTQKRGTSARTVGRVQLNPIPARNGVAIKGGVRTGKGSQPVDPAQIRTSLWGGGGQGVGEWARKHRKD